MPSFEQLNTWQANDWDDLSRIWRDLVGTDAVVDYKPIFAGEEITLQQAGYVFQTWILEGFRISGVVPDPPFAVSIDPGVNDRTRRQLDGMIEFDCKYYLIESKFSKEDFSSVANLHLHVESRPVGTLGLIFAAKGFTTPAIESAFILRPIRVLLFNNKDLEYALTSRDFLKALRLKLKYVTKYGIASFDISDPN